jgi:hypothetical protein
MFEQAFKNVDPRTWQAEAAVPALAEPGGRKGRAGNGWPRSCRKRAASAYNKLSRENSAYGSGSGSEAAGSDSGDGAGLPGVRPARGTRLMWTCPNCQSKVDDAFEVCWSCGTFPDGEQDPIFARADDIVPTSEATFPSRKKTLENDLELPPAEPEVDLVACYWARNCNEAMFLANQLVFEGIPATADSHDLRIVFAGFWGIVPAGPYFSPRVWVLAQDAPKVRDWLAGYEQRRKARTKLRRGWITWL